MNLLEHQMVQILKEMKEIHGAVSVRAEFEAEGTRLEELLRLKEISMAADLGLTLKIGGCESVRDMLESRIIGVNYLVAPMIESSYALKKYLQAIVKIIPLEEKNSIKFLINIETLSAIEDLDEILSIEEISLLDGIVIERVDLCFSLGLTENDINEDKINKMVGVALKKIKIKNISTTIGGGVGSNTVPFFRSLQKGVLDYFETRKVCFDYSKGMDSSPEKAILKALGFERLWLKNKLLFYKNISLLDKQRISLIEQRYQNEIDGLLSHII